MSKDAIAATVTDGQRWRDLEVTDASMLQLAADVALLTLSGARFPSAGADDEPCGSSKEPAQLALALAGKEGMLLRFARSRRRAREQRKAGVASTGTDGVIR